MPTVISETRRRGGWPLPFVFVVCALLASFVSGEGDVGAVATAPQYLRDGRLAARALDTSASETSAGGSSKEETCGEVVNATKAEDIKHVSVQMYIMSTCKYGQTALSGMLDVVSACEPKHTKVQVDVIGHGTAQRGFSSTLGRNDVIGDVYMLCAQHVFSTKSVAKVSIPYFQCLIEDSDGDMGALGESCKSEVDNTQFQEAVYRCVRSRSISFALEESFDKAHAAKAVVSPTIFINEEPYCGPRTSTALEDAVAKAMKGVSMSDLGACNENNVSPLEKGCEDKGTHGGYSILLFMILFSSTATLMVIACFAAFRRFPGRRGRDERENGGFGRGIWLTAQNRRGNVQPAQRRGTPNDVVNSFDKVVFEKLPATEEEVDQCSICICEYEAGEEVMVLPCNHRFHGDCIRQWLDQSTKCPLCNQQVVEPPAATSSAGSTQDTGAPSAVNVTPRET